MMLAYGQQSRILHGTPLVDSLNELIEKLNMPLPFALETPFDLTPGLLLGILESILETRLPIAASIRASRDFANKVQAMKVFLGILEYDILGGQDVGLSEVDPRRLAAGEEDEVEFVGELLCWLGRKRGILAGSSCDNEPPPALPLRARRRASSPSTHSTVTSGAHSNLSMMHTILADTDTTVMSTFSEPLAPLVHPELPDLPSLPHDPHPPTGSTSHPPQPRCIHELDEPSFAFDGFGDFTAEMSVCHCTPAGEDAEDDLPPTPKTPLPFRYEGWIEKADESAELQVYYRRKTPPASTSASSSAARRAMSYSGVPAFGSPSHPHNHSSSSGGSRRIVTPHNAPTEYTLALLNERARLLDELAKVRGTPSVR